MIQRLGEPQARMREENKERIGDEVQGTSIPQLVCCIPMLTCILMFRNPQDEKIPLISLELPTTESSKCE
ncbi:Protein BEX1 [Manis javanica]|nr:Protein BEX1 [Manis javanica]